MLRPAFWLAARVSTFAKKVIREGEIPFKLGLDKTKVYDNVEEMWEDLKK